MQVPRSSGSAPAVRGLVSGLGEGRGTRVFGSRNPLSVFLRDVWGPAEVIEEESLDGLANL